MKCTALLPTLLLLLAASAATAGPLGPAFTYQGELRDGGTLASGLYDLEVRLFDASTNGGEVASAIVLNDVPVAEGRFTVGLDFGAGAFVGAERWLQLAVRPGASAAAYTVVLPRQLLRAAPEALRAATSATAPWSGLTGVPAGFADGVDNGVTSVGSGTGSPAVRSRARARFRSTAAWCSSASPAIARTAPP
jgi:hypothetical protein